MKGMHYAGRAGVLLFVAFYGASSEAQQLVEAVENALLAHEAILEADANMDATRFELRQAEGLRYPQVDLEIRATTGYSDRDIGGSAGRESGFGVGDSASINLEQLLYDGGATTAEIARQRWRLRSSTLRLVSRREAIALDALRAYLEVLKAGDLIDISRRNLRSHEQTAISVRRLVDGGGAGVGDLRLTQERLAAAQVDLAVAEAILEDAQASFRRITDLEPSVLVLPAFPERFLPLSQDEAVEAAVSSYPELLVAQADERATSEELEAVRASRLPRVTLGGGVGTSEDINQSDGRDYEATVMLRMTVSLFDGSIRSNRENEIAARRKGAQYRADRIRRDVALDVRQSWVALQTGRRSVEIEQRRVRSATEVVQTYRREFEAGRRSLLDLLNAENILVNAETALANARYEAEFAGYRLLSLTGEMLPALGVPETVMLR